MFKNTVKKTAALLMTASIFGAGAAAPGYAATTQSPNIQTHVTTYTFTSWNEFYNWLQSFLQQNQATRQISVQKPVTQPSTQIPVQKPVTQPTPAQKTAGTGTPQTTANHSSVPAEVQQVVNLVNQERQKAGLKPLTLNVSLDRMAQVKAEDMRDHHYFDHTSPTYGSPFDMMTKFGISYSYAGENIAAGQPDAASVMKDWMNSSGHRANILNPNYTQIGVGVAHGGPYGTYWVQEFIRP
jgi:uncharacterized YkwD family protein